MNTASAIRVHKLTVLAKDEIVRRLREVTLTRPSRTGQCYAAGFFAGSVAAMVGAKLAFVATILVRTFLGDFREQFWTRRR